MYSYITLPHLCTMRKIIAYKGYYQEFMSSLSDKENIMCKKDNQIYDVSAELAREFGEVGSESREQAIAHAWEEYNAQILLDARKNAGLTQAELAARIGADKGYISRVERGLTIPTVSTLYKIAAAMGLVVTLQPAQ